MPKYKVTDPETGKTLILTGDSPPTQAEIEEIFSSRTSDRMTSPEQAAPSGGTMGWLKDKVIGNPEFDYPSIEERGYGETLPSAQSSMDLSRALFSGDKGAMEQAITKNIPGATVQDDARGYQYFQSPDEPGRYTEKPGLDMEDVGAGVAKTLAYATGATGKVLKTGAVEAGINTLLQWLGKGKVDPAETAIAGVTGGVTEGLAPIIGRWGRQLKEMLSSGNEVMAGKLIARELKIPGADQLADDVYINLANQAKRQVMPNVRPEARIAEAEFGIKTTPAQQTDDLGRWRGQEMALETNPKVAQFMNEQNRGMNTALDDFQSQIGGVPAPRNQDQAAEAFTQGTRNTAQARRNEVDQAYRVAANEPAAVRPEAFPGLINRFSTWIDENRMGRKGTNKLYPGSRVAKEELDEISQDFISLTQQGNAFEAPYMQLEETRRVLLDAYQSAANPADRRKVKQLQTHFDEWLDESVDQGMINGSPNFLDNLKNARNLHATYKQDFAARWRKHGKDKIGEVIEQIADGELDGRQATNIIYGMSNISKDTAIEFAQRLKGKISPDAWNALRESAVEKLLNNNKTGDRTATYRALLNNLKSAQGDGQFAKLFETLMTEQERNKMSRITMALQSLLPESSVSRANTGNSITANRSLGFITGMARNTPGLRWIAEMLSGAAEGYGVRSTTGGLMTTGPVGSPYLIGGTTAGSDMIR